MGNVVSYLDSNKKKAEKARKLDKETEKIASKIKGKYQFTALQIQPCL